MCEAEQRLKRLEWRVAANAGLRSDDRKQLPGRTSRNPVYPRAALKVVEWVTAELAAGRRHSQADVDARMETILREETEAAK
jgi:hypothetical protein